MADEAQAEIDKKKKRRERREKREAKKAGAAGAPNSEEKKKARLDRREKRKAAKASEAPGREERKKARIEKRKAKKTDDDTSDAKEKKRTRLKRRKKRKAAKANALARKKRKKRLEKRKAKNAGATDTSATEKKNARLQRRKKRQTAKAPVEVPPESGTADSETRRKALRERRQKRIAARAAAAEKKAEMPAATKKEAPVFQLQSTEEEVVASFAALDAMVLSGLPRHRFVVDVTGVAFHAYFQRSEYNRLFVMLGGEAPKDRKSTVHFERRAWGEMLPGSVLWISDPTLGLSDEISLGWYVGTRDKDYTAQMAKLVDRVATDLGLARSDIIFYGGSGGGFAALMCARFLPGANCIVINPQIDLSKHKPEHRRKLAKVFSGDENFKAVASEHPDRVSVLAAFPDRAKLPPLVYVQNRQDKDHFDAHYALFCETYSAAKEGGISENGRVLTLLFEHGAGHVHEPRPIVRPLLTQALAFFDQFRQSKK